MDELAQVRIGPRPWARWSVPADDAQVPTTAVRWLVHQVGPLEPLPPVPPEAAPLPPSRLPETARADLVRIVGPDQVDVTDTGRRAHAGGQSYSDLIRRRTGTDLAFPDGVIAPATHDDVRAVLTTCADHRIAIVPYGGATSVVGGVEPESRRRHAVLALDLRRMARLLAIDPDSQTATFEPGLTGPDAERLLAPYGSTLGHVPQSFARASLGGYVATHSAGQASTGYGRIDDLVVALRIATPQGELRLGTGTPNAAGPDLRALFVGSEGALGVITELTLRIRPAPRSRRYEMWAFPSFPDGLAALRRLAQDGPVPDVVRLSDETESHCTRILQGTEPRALSRWLRLRGIELPALCVFGWEGSPPSVRRRRRAGLGPIRRAGGVPLGRGAGETWRRHRFVGPHQRDALLDEGVLVETLETATTWSRLPELYAAVRHALHRSLSTGGRGPVLMTHVSHVYPTGASLYVTVLGRQPASGADALAQWRRAKADATEAILASGGTLTHHHGVGREHAPYLSREVGELGVHALSQAKAAVDPAGILNPGALIDD